MKCNRKALYEALVALGKVAGSSVSVPILNTVMLESSGGRLKMRTTDLERTLTTEIESEEEILCCVSVDKLAKVVKPDTKEDGKIELKVSAERLMVIADNMKINLPIADVADFPKAPPIDGWSSLGAWESKGLAYVLAFVLPAASTDPTRPHICHVKFQDGVVVSTDGHRMHVMPSQNVDTDFTIHSSYAKSLACLLSHGETVQAFAHDESSLVTFHVHHGSSTSASHYKYTCKAGTEPFPPYENVICKKEQPIKVNAAKYVKTLKRLVSLIDARFHVVKLTVAKNVTLAFDDENGNEISGEVETTNDSDEARLPAGFNADYLIESMIGLGGTDEAEITITTPLEPMRVDAVDGRIAIIMPTRL